MSPSVSVAAPTSSDCSDTRAGKKPQNSEKVRVQNVNCEISGFSAEGAPSMLSGSLEVI